jgi:hypothetical protein
MPDNNHSFTSVGWQALLIVKRLRKARGVDWQARGPPAHFSGSRGIVKPAGEQGPHTVRSLKPREARERE